MTVEVGGARAAPGELARDYLDVTALPTGAPERLPVIVANGERDGATLWITAAIHGDEVTGTAVAQDVMDAVSPDDLRGAVVCLPTLNPAGLRRTTRSSYYHGQDPNRHFPAPGHESSRPPKVQAVIDRRLYDLFADSADALLDLHTAQVGSIPFVIRDRVLYGEVGEDDPDGSDSGTPTDADDREWGAPRDEGEARDLADDLEDLVKSLGLPVVNEYAPDEYREQNLQRSTAGAALNAAGIPACTLELGSHSVVEEDNRALGVAAVARAMVELGMLDALPAEVSDRRFEAPLDGPVKRHVGPHAKTAGIVRHRVAAGDTVEEGDPVADVVAPTGTHRATLTTDHEGYVLGRWSGVAAYENDPVASLAVRDDGDLVAPRRPDE